MEERELNQIPVEQNSAEAQDHQSCILHAAVTDIENDNLGIFRSHHLPVVNANHHCANQS